MNESAAHKPRNRLSRGCRTAIVVALSTFLAGAGLLVLSFWPVKGDRYDERHFDNGSLTVRVTAYHEEGPFIPGAYFVFEGRASPTTDWHLIQGFRHDDPVPIPDECVKFLDNDIAFAFIGWKYAVSTNRGRSWTTWDAWKDLPGYEEHERTNYRYITDVQLQRGGKGIMLVHPLRWKEVTRLFTEDFGRTWRR